LQLSQFQFKNIFLSIFILHYLISFFNSDLSQILTHAISILTKINRPLNCQQALQKNRPILFF